MNIIPEGLRADFDYKNALEKWTPCGHPQVLKPVLGSYGSLSAEFRVVEEFSAADSKASGKEMTRDVEVVLIRADKFSNIPKRLGRPGMQKVGADGKPLVDQFGRPIREGEITSELSPEEQIKLAPLYERFKNQRASGESDIMTWEAVSDGERLHLASSGIFTVEQLHNIPEHEQYRLGPGAVDLKERAARHMATKREKDPKERQREMALLVEEREKLAARDREREAEMYKLQEKIAKMERESEKPQARKRHRGPNKKKTVLPGPVETAETKEAA